MPPSAGRRVDPIDSSLRDVRAVLGGFDTAQYCAADRPFDVAGNWLRRARPQLPRTEIPPLTCGYVVELMGIEPTTPCLQSTLEPGR
jgi:hypothetical protein